MNNSSRYYVLVNGHPEGPLDADALVTATNEHDPLVCQVGQREWVRVSTIPDLAARFPPPPPVAPRATSEHRQTEQFLFFDPSQPRVVGLMVLYGWVIVPLLYVTGVYYALSAVGEFSGPGRDASIVLVVALLVASLVVAILLAIAANALRHKWPSRWGWAISAYVISVANSLLQTLVVALVITMAQSQQGETPSAVQGVPEQSAFDLLLNVVSVAGGCFEVFAILWLLFNRRQLRSS